MNTPMEAISDDRVRELMTETGWLRRLARSMVKDPDAADDLAQDAWIIATQKAPTDGRPLRPWLARVLLNLVRMRSRGDKRRTAREQRSDEVIDRGESTPEQLYERVEMQRMLADAVLALSPIYRDVVLMHYVDGLTSIDIGMRLGLSEGTVRWRLKSAIDQMREAFDQKQKGNRALWLAPMLRFAQPDSPAAATKSGAGLAAAILLAALLVGGLAVLLGTRSSSPASRASEPSQPLGTAGREPLASMPSSETPAASIPAWAVQEGVAGKRIAGVVRSRSVAVSKAKVVLHMIKHPEEPIAVVVSGPDGAFDFGVQPAVEYVVGASSPGLTPAVVVVEAPDPSPRVPHDKLVVELEACEARVFGTISDASGGPIAHASVRLDKIIGTESDRDGGYELCVRTMPNWIVAGADGYALAGLRLRWDGGAAQRDITLVPEGTIVGKVVTLDGTPVPGARIEATPMLTNDAVGQTVIADDDGNFQVPQLASAQYRLEVDADGLVGNSEPIDVRAGTATPPQTIVIGVASTIRARVFVDGKPAIGARITLSSANGDHTASGYVQADGSLVIKNVTPDVSLVSAATYRVVTPQRVDVTSTTAPFTITLARLSSIAGRVHRDGLPIDDGVVSCLPLASDTKASPDGSFLLEGLDGSSCELYAYSLGTATTSVRTMTALEPARKTIVDIDLANDASIEGIVVDERGAPIAGADVRFFGDTDGGRGITGHDGRFRIGSLIGSMELRPLVFPSPFDSVPFAWVEPQPVVRLADGHSKVTGVRLAIRNVRGVIRGVVIDDRQQPVADATVTAFGSHNNNENTTRLVRTGIDGRFEIDGLAHGRFRLHANGADSSIAMQENVATGSEVTLVLPRSGRVEGAVVGFTESPYVVAADHERGIVIDALVTADRRFRTLGLTPGTYLLSATGGGSAIQRVVVRSGEVTRADLVSGGTSRIEITLVLHGERTPIANADCVATASAFGYPGWWNGAHTRTDAGGRAVIATGPAGHVRVQCTPRGSSPAASEIDIVPSSVASVTLVSVAMPPREVDAGFDIQPFEMPTRVWRVRGRHAAALAAGDVILALDGEDVSALGPMAVWTLIQRHEPGSHVVVTFKRGGVVRMTTLVLRRITDQ